MSLSLSELVLNNMFFLLLLQGLDSVSAAKVTAVLHAVAHDADSPTAVIATIHQPNSQIYQTFDRIVLLAGGRAMYEGPGGLTPADYFAERGSPCNPGYNVADHLLDLAHAPSEQRDSPSLTKEGGAATEAAAKLHERGSALWRLSQPRSAAAFLTQMQVLAGREWKILGRFVVKTRRKECRALIFFFPTRDKTFFVGHIVISAFLGVFCGGLYWHTGTNIAGFQSRVGCLFFMVRL
jgi:hypothetical protein